MPEQQWAAIDHYFTQLLVPSDAALDATLKSSADAGLPAINVAPNQGKFLYLLAKISKARRILEIGTLGGYSTIWLARALPAEGRLVSLETNARHAGLAKQNIATAELSAQVSIIVGDATQSLESMVDENVEPFDLVFIDADKERNPDYLRLSLALSRAGTVIIGDNVVRQGRVGDPDNHDSDVTGVRTFLELARADTRLESTVLQTVGLKGWDGFSISLVSGQG